MNMKQKNLYSLFVLICGTILVITGIVVLVFAENHCGVSGGGISRANTEITFGADYYTTMAQYNALNTNAMVDTYRLLKNCFGIIFIFSGLLTIFLNLPNALKLFKFRNELIVAETEKGDNENLITEGKSI